MRVVNSPLKYSGTSARAAGPPPMLGQHNREVLSGLLDYDKEQLDSLEAAGVIYTEEDALRQ